MAQTHPREKLILRQIRRLWLEGRDTLGIANRMRVKEDFVYNRLTQARNSK